MSKSLSKKVCENWKKSCENGVFKNPETGRKIKPDGPTYKKIVKKCGSPKVSLKKSSPKRYALDCNKWKKGWISGEKVNPETRRKIKQDGPKYKELVKKCGDPYVKPKSQKKKSPPKLDDKFIFEEKLKFILEPDEEEDLESRFAKLMRRKNAFKFRGELDSIQENLDYLHQVNEERQKKIRSALERRMDILERKI